ncbi:MAG: two-component regulator propeller domain-containing protein, partial [Ignavibacteria bacterium]|nr:two-component regulator propeller domain-containing protein [Ignavibacteria bacterium]
LFTLEEDQNVLIICVGEGRKIQGYDGVFDKGSLYSTDEKTLWSMDNLNQTFNAGGAFKNRIAVQTMKLKKGDYKISYSSDVGHSYGSWNALPPRDSTWYGIQIVAINDADFEYINKLNESESSSSKHLPLEIGTCMEFSKRLLNVVWLGSRASGFFKYNTLTGDYTQYNYDSKNKFSPNNAITNIFEDKQGIVWIATQNKLIRFDPESENIEKFDQKDGLPSSLISSIIEDFQGNLWITSSGGLSKLNKNDPKDQWNFVNFDTRDGLQNYGFSRTSWISNSGELLFGGIEGITSFFPGKINKTKPEIVITDIKIAEVSLKSDSDSLKLKKNVMQTEQLNLSFDQNNLSFEFSSIHFSSPE